MKKVNLVCLGELMQIQILSPCIETQDVINKKPVK